MWHLEYSGDDGLFRSYIASDVVSTCRTFFVLDSSVRTHSAPLGCGLAVAWASSGPEGTQRKSNSELRRGETPVWRPPARKSNSDYGAGPAAAARRSAIGGDRGTGDALEQSGSSKD